MQCFIRLLDLLCKNRLYFNLVLTVPKPDSFLNAQPGSPSAVSHFISFVLSLMFHKLVPLDRLKATMELFVEERTEANMVNSGSWLVCLYILNDI